MSNLFKYILIAIIAISVLTACNGEATKPTSGDHMEAHEFAPNITPTLNDNYVENFALMDHLGAAHELYYYEDAPAIVLMIQGNGCPIVRNIWSDLKSIRDKYEAKGVRFYMLNANIQDDRSEIAAEAEKYSIDIPILKDDAQLIAASLGVTRTAEVFVIDPSSWEIVYRGPVNDRLGYERQKREASENYLNDVLAAHLNGAPIDVSTRATKGCLVNLGAANDLESHKRISYSETIAPMLIENCVTCHQDGGIGPWAMSDYDMVYGFSPMIREVVRTKRMPPWSADPEIGKFHGARQLSVSQKQDLIRWIEADAPRGEGPDPLLEHEADITEWPLGAPDLIVEAPSFKVPATGIIDYQFPTVLNPLNKDVWVKAITVLPGDREVVHHALIGSSENVTEDGQGDDRDVFENYLVGFVPGSESYVYPDNSGVLVKAGGEYRFQFHYTPSGRETTDKTKIGLYFHEKPPAHILRQQVALNFRINIPPGADNHVEQAYFEFDHPAEIFLLFPHAHYRGKSSRFDLQFPDGSEETLLSVPKYDFNWQHNYALAEPVSVPAGSRLIHTTVFDNSARNFANPDPEQTVTWGLQSADEMLYGSFFFRWTEETAENPVHDPLQFELRQFYGFADADMDGKLQPSEMRRGLRSAWDAGKLTMADQDNDGALSFQEFYMMEKFKAAQQ